MGFGSRKRRIKLTEDYLKRYLFELYEEINAVSKLENEQYEQERK